MLTPDQIRQSFVAFFEARGHTRVASDTLVPRDDPTLLFTGAGMNQFKAAFLGKGNLPYRRATTVQKCMRMPDLENVGRTASHHTFFEMLGNFSFGDYFKAEAITWAWELLQEWGLPTERLSVTVFTDDDEAATLWSERVGLPRERLFRCGEADNFWPASAPSQGPNGLCGPCSEIYFDCLPGEGPMPPGGPSSDGRRFVEIWNLVFTQFERRDGGILAPLPHRNIDTGAGFERLVRVIESVQGGALLPSNFDTSLFRPLLEAIHAHVGRQTAFGTPEGASVRRIADHVRAAVFCIADGVRPSNVKQGYVVRKILRRAMLDRHVLGGDLRSPWLHTLAGVVAQSLGGAWPELREASALASATIAAEEEKFAGAFLSGSQKLAVLAEEAEQTGRTTLAGPAAFLLYDTFGLPLDLQRLLLAERRMDIDEEGFRAELAEQRRRSREGSRISDKIFDEGPLAAVAGSLPATEFVRDRLELEAQALAVVDEGEGEPRRVLLVLDRTPFYAEGGGQVGDAGEIAGAGWRVVIDDTVALRGISLHRGTVVEGVPVPGRVQARVDAALRAATARNHTATHLLHAALRHVLGEEVTQAGSLVAPDRLRFDFRFARAPTPAELDAVEDLVNAWILGNAEVGARSMPRDEARQAGAMALFGEKYGDVVRVISVPAAGKGPQSIELCGGTHVLRAGDIGLLHIIAEGSVAAGIRRVEARTGLGLVDTLREGDRRLRSAAALLKASPEQLGERIAALQDELKSVRRDLEELRSRTAGERLAAAVRPWNELTVLVSTVEGIPVKTLRELAGDWLRRVDLVVLAAPEGEAASYLVASGPAAQKRGVKANAVVAALAAALGGKGGGSAECAQGRGRGAADLQAVLEGSLDAAVAARS